MINFLSSLCSRGTEENPCWNFNVLICSDSIFTKRTVSFSSQLTLYSNLSNVKHMGDMLFSLLPLCCYHFKSEAQLWSPLKHLLRWVFSSTIFFPPEAPMELLRWPRVERRDRTGQRPAVHTLLSVNAKQSMHFQCNCVHRGLNKNNKKVLKLWGTTRGNVATNLGFMDKWRT